MAEIDKHRLFGEHLKKIRKSRGLTQENLAEKCGVTHQYIGLIETGRKNPGLDLLFRLSKNLDITPAQILAIPELADSTTDKLLALVSESSKKKQKMILTAVRAMVE